MNNLPATLEGLIVLLRQFESEATVPEFGTVDYDMFAEKVLVTLEQYEHQTVDANQGDKTDE